MSESIYDSDMNFKRRKKKYRHRAYKRGKKQNFTLSIRIQALAKAHVLVALSTLINLHVVFGYIVYNYVILFLTCTKLK